MILRRKDCRTQSQVVSYLILRKGKRSELFCTIAEQTGEKKLEDSQWSKAN